INTGTWGKAIAHYHSSKPEFYLIYREKVLKKWAKVQNGRMTTHELFEGDQSAIAMNYSEIQKYKGEFVENVAEPSGRRLPMIVRFAPYKGFHGRISGVSQLTPKSMACGPKIIRGRPKGSGKIIINAIGMIPHQKPFRIQGTGKSSKIIHV